MKSRRRIRLLLYTIIPFYICSTLCFGQSDTSKESSSEKSSCDDIIIRAKLVTSLDVNAHKNKPDEEEGGASVIVIWINPITFLDKIEYEGGDLDIAVALGKKDYDTLKLLLEKGADVNYEYTLFSTYENAPILSYVVDIGEEKLTEILLEYNADVNKATALGTTPLMIAARQGYKEIVKMLIENGADPNAKRKDDVTALKLAETNRHYEIIELLSRYVVDTEEE